MNKVYLTLILPIYNEEGNIEEVYKRSTEVLKSFKKPYEIIFINDGSRDSSISMLRELAKKDEAIKVLNFSRNFGHQIAITAGLDYASGEAVIIMDADLQDKPEVIPEMVKEWQKGFDVIYGRRKTRKDTIFKKYTAWLFYRAINKLANIDIPLDTGDFRLMDRKVVDEMVKLREHSRFMRGLTSWCGFNQTAVYFDRDERRFGVTNYPLKKMIKFALDGITAFSYVPLKLSTYLGFVAAFIGFCYGVFEIIKKIIAPSSNVPGWTSLIIIVLFIGGIQLIILGIVGEYIGRIYTEAQNRPLYVVRDAIGFSKKND